MQTLQELASTFERHCLKPARSNLTANDQAGVVEFGWQSRHCRPDEPEVMEKKDKNLHITGASMLMQARS